MEKDFKVNFHMLILSEYVEKKAEGCGLYHTSASCLFAGLTIDLSDLLELGDVIYPKSYIDWIVDRDTFLFGHEKTIV